MLWTGFGHGEPAGRWKAKNWGVFRRYAPASGHCPGPAERSQAVASGRAHRWAGPQERVRLRNVIATVALDKVVIWTTHIVSDIEFIARDILMLKSGQLIARGRLRSWWRVCRVRSLRSRCSLGRCPNGRTKLWWATYSGGKETCFCGLWQTNVPVACWQRQTWRMCICTISKRCQGRVSDD